MSDHDSNTNRLLLQPSVGSRYTFLEISRWSEPRDPPTSMPSNTPYGESTSASSASSPSDVPILDLCWSGTAVNGHAHLQLPFSKKGAPHQQHVRIEDDDDEMDDDDDDASSYPPISLVRRNNPTQAYGIFENRMISLNHHYPNWGCVYPSCLVYERIGSTNKYKAPATLQEAKYVAIKKLSKSAIARSLREGGRENPYLEIARMQELGDNIHVMRHIEALQDSNYDDEASGYIFIVMPQAITPRPTDRGPSLKDVIFSYTPASPMEPNRVHAIFVKLLRIALYLEERYICHRDLSPDNFLFLEGENLVVCDLALSIRIPQVKYPLELLQSRIKTDKFWHYALGPILKHAPAQLAGTAAGVLGYKVRTLINDVGNFGTVAWMAPEIYHGRIFDGVYTDLWQIAVVLYNMATCHILYRIPHTIDPSFLYFIMARGLSSTPTNEMTADVLAQFFQPSGAGGTADDMRNINTGNYLIQRAMAHFQMCPNIMELLDHLLHPNVQERWTLAQAIESNFVQHGSSTNEDQNSLDFE